MKVRLALVVAAALAAAACSSDDRRGAEMHASPSAGARGASRVATAASAHALNDAATGHRFARVPDRGSLVRYPDQRVVREDGAYTWHRADLSESHALSAIGGTLAMTTPAGELLRFRYERHVEHPNGDWTWVGSLGNGSMQEAVITFGAKAAFGSIGQPGKEALRLTIRNGASWLVETDLGEIAKLDNVGTRPTKPDFLIAPEVATSVRPRVAASTALLADAPRAASAGTAAAAAAATTTVDVVLGYTNGFASGLGGESAAQTRLNNLVEITNEAYANSQIDARIRLVRTVAVNYPDATANDEALEELTGYRDGSNITPNAAFNPLRAARDQYGADLVSLVRKFNSPENDGCGIAWMLGGGGARNQIFSNSSERFGYSVVSDGEDAGADGKTYFCRQETLAHEMGHNMGAAHDRDTADGDDNVIQDSEYGVFDYSFGYKTTPGAGNFYTVMAYGDSGQVRNRIFSNPRIAKCGAESNTTQRGIGPSAPIGTLPCGTESADNARTLSQTMPVVSTFRASVVPLPPPGPGPGGGARGDANADGRSDILWHNPSAQQFQPWLMNGANLTYGTASAISGKYRIAATADFSGDGRVDLLWYDTAKTELWAWIANGDGGYAVAFLRNYPTGWEPVGVGDANADGRADVFWHSPTAQGMQVWLMNGASWTYGPNNPVGSQYRIVSVGDYNGDGLADVLWRDTANTVLWQWQAQGDGGYAVVFMRDYPGGWSVAATGDGNADGKADVFWHNPTAQGTQMWFMQGTTWSYGAVNAISSQYRVATAGDFNGDGLMDIVWVDSGNVWTWLANGSGGFSVNFVRNYPTGWSIWNYGAVNYNGGVYGGL